MNTKVEEALDHVTFAAEMLVDAAYHETAEQTKQAHATLTAHIAQQDATIARMFTREQVAELMREMVPALRFRDQYDDEAEYASVGGHNRCREQILARVEAWQNQEQVK